MTSLKKQRIKTVMKYTWPFYIVSAIIIAILLSIIFNVAHPLAAYKKLTIFVSGQVIDSKKLEDDLTTKYQDKELKSVETISVLETDPTFSTKLTVAGYSSADIIIVSQSEMANRSPSIYGLELDDEILNSYFNDLVVYTEEIEGKEVGLAILLDKDIVKDYITLGEGSYYMVLNANSENLGQYSNSQIKEHDLALKVVQDWGSHV